jgi:hypothetical protein
MHTIVHMLTCYRGRYTTVEPDWDSVNVVAEGGFASVTDEHVRRYASEGYLLVRNGYSNLVTQDALEAIERICAEADPRFEKACEGTVFDPERASLGYDDPGVQFEAAGAGRPKGQRAKFVRKLKCVTVHVENAVHGASARLVHRSMLPTCCMLASSVQSTRNRFVL